MKKKQDSTFIVMWCNEGLECIVPLHMEEWEKYQNDIILNKLADDYPPENEHIEYISTLLNALILRSQINSQRNYEIYSLLTSADIDEKYLRELFVDNPQMIVDLIREKGICLYGTGRGKKAKPLIL